MPLSNPKSGFEDTSRQISSLDNRALNLEYGVHYPHDLNLQPNSEAHAKLVALVSQCAQAGYSHISERFSSWHQIDETLTGYIPLDEAETLIKSQDDRIPVSIVIPITYAILDVLLTRFIQVFLNEPIFQLSGVESKDMYGAELLNKLLEVHTIKYGIGLALHTFWRDTFAYGFGVASPQWTQEFGSKYLRSKSFFGSKMKLKENVVIGEGNTLENVSPYCYLPDPTVPIDKPQDGTFNGWVERTTRHKLLTLEKHDSSTYFNCKYLHLINTRSKWANFDTVSGNQSVGAYGSNPAVTAPVDLINMYIDVIPADYGLGKSLYPEQWFFSLAGDELIVRAQPLNLNSGKRPIVVAATNFTGKLGLPISELEMIQGLQIGANYFYNSHMANISKALNLGYLADPMGVNLNDLMNPSPGMIVRTHPARWGRGVKDVLEQLKVNDYTKDNLNHVRGTIDLISRTVGATEPTQGMLRTSSERRSATEAHEAFTSALGRILHSAYIVSNQAHLRLAEMMGSNTQQFISEPAFVSTVGDFATRLREEYSGVQPIGKRVKVRPDDVRINYNVVARDNSMAPEVDTNTKLQLLQIITSFPALASQVDLLKLFKSIARGMGFKNVDDFVEKAPPYGLGRGMEADVRPDEEVRQEAKAGNLVPVEALEGLR